MFNSLMYQTAFNEIGIEWTVTDELIKVLLYGWSESDINTVRYNCFIFGQLSDTAMPPNKESLKLHIMRANCQARIYKCSLKQHIMAPPPAGQGWKVVDSSMVLQWSTMPVAPDAVQKYVHCNCRKSSCNNNLCS
jgi:hypothetical protein